jgi:hypothetical protein
MQLHNLDKILEAIITLQLSIDHNDIVSSLQKDQFLSKDVEKHVINMSTKKLTPLPNFLVHIIVNIHSIIPEDRYDFINPLLTSTLVFYFVMRLKDLLDLCSEGSSNIYLDIN